jgi:hypothetical protein
LLLAPAALECRLLQRPVTQQPPKAEEVSLTTLLRLVAATVAAGQQDLIMLVLAVLEAGVVLLIMVLVVLGLLIKGLQAQEAAILVAGVAQVAQASQKHCLILPWELVLLE